VSTDLPPMSGDDIAGLFRPKPAAGALPVAARTGILAAWNPVSGNNTVLVDDVPLIDLPIVASQALTLAVGDTLMLHLIGGSWYIVGQVAEPGGARAAQMLAARTYTDIEPSQDLTSSTSFSDLAPVVAVDVPVPATGRVLVTWSALIGWAASGTDYGGTVALAYEGANSHPADDLLMCRHISTYSTSEFRLEECSVSRTEVISGLTPGLTTFRLRFRAQVAGVGATFSHRYLSIILL
jgi:hypothetical protein